MFLRILLLSILGFIIFRSVRNFFLGASSKERVKNKPVQEEEDFQEKHKNKIEDADFEELD